MGRGWSWMIAGVVAAGALTAWVTAGALFVTGAERIVLGAAVVAAVVMTELLAWTAAALLGFAALRNRGRLWARLTGRGGAA